MAKRNVLHISKLENLKKWLVKDGWQLLPLSNNHYEVLRASKAGKQNPLVIYSAKSSEHLSFADRDMPVIGAFLRDQKKPQTNADRIRSMTDEDAEEQGLLLRLPISEDTPVYSIEYCCGKNKSNRSGMCVRGFCENCSDKAYYIRESIAKHCSICEINKSVFFTHEEAEVKLKEMEEKDGR